MSRFSLLLIILLSIAAILLSARQLEASSSQGKGTRVNWPSNKPYLQGTIPPVVDLSISMSDSPDPVTVGTPLTYTITTINNNSLQDAMNVILVDSLPLSVNLRSVVPSQGSCSGTSLIICNLNTLSKNLTAVLTVVVTPTQPGTITNSVTVMSADINDPDPTNNFDLEGTRVVVGGTQIYFYLPIILK